LGIIEKRNPIGNKKQIYITKFIDMSKIVSRIWGIVLSIIFHCARIVFSVTKTQVRGTLVAIWYKGRILLIQKSYRKVWSLPGGLLNKGETLEQAAVRETFEEVGVSLNEKDLVFIAELQGELGPCDRVNLFEVQVNGPVDVEIDGREIVTAEFVQPDKALERDLYHHVEKYLRLHAEP
jgi:8-oxo-dGTP pyrophosphatase MutT (NUDIX family)